MYLFFLIKKANICAANNPCKNGGVCRNVNDEDSQYECSCPAGCTGKNCEFCTGCTSSFCANGGFCLLNGTGSPYCVCPNGFKGLICQDCKLCFFL